VRRALATTITALGVLAIAAGILPAISAAAPATDPSPDPVIEWNRFLLDLQATAGHQPATVHPTYELAVMHAAIYDAVVAIDHRGAPYLTTVHGPRGASATAAADAAARDTLSVLSPAQRASIDDQYHAMIKRIPSGRRRALGMHVGRRVAAQILARRTGDGVDAMPVPFVPGTGAGEYQLTPPAFAQPVFTHWARVRPFALRHATQFRPPPPPALTSTKYAAAINEVKALGSAQGSTRTPDQTQIGLFWNPPIWAAWNRIAQTAALDHQDGLAENARTFAALNLTFADAVIAFYDAKYTYRFWRPVTAIRAADSDGNADTVADPAYPGAHGTISAAGAAVLSAVYGNDFAFAATSTALPGVERTFVSFSEAAEEASESRIFNGNHTRLDEVAGENLGRDTAEFVLHHTLSARDR
jgi:hypothetical protein